jgi:hypothetical protein
MKIPKKQILAACLSLMLVSGYGDSMQRIGSYDFSYELTGSPRVKPVQVFDDGRSTFFQFRAGEPIPAIFANTQTGPVMQIPEMQGPYVRVSGVVASYTLRIGYVTCQVDYNGQRGSTSGPAAAEKPESITPAKQAGDASIASSQSLRAGMRQATYRIDAAMGAVTAPSKGSVYEDGPLPNIALYLNSYATPIKGDLAQFKAGTPQDTTEVVTVSRNEVPFAGGMSKLGPLGRKSVEAIASSFSVGGRIELLVREDTNGGRLYAARTKSIVAALVASGVPIDSIAAKQVNRASSALLAASDPSVPSVVAIVKGPNKLIATGMSPAQPHTGYEEVQIHTWKLRATDVTVQGTLQRWADEAGWTLIWKNGPEVKVTGDAEMVRDGFIAAADYVLAQARAYGHPIKGRAYNNKVLVVSGG